METSNIRKGRLSNTICCVNLLTKARHRVCISFMTLVLCAYGKQHLKYTRVVICCFGGKVVVAVAMLTTLLRKYTVLAYIRKSLPKLSKISTNCPEKRNLYLTQARRM